MKKYVIGTDNRDVDNEQNTESSKFSIYISLKIAVLGVCFNVSNVSCHMTA